MAILRVAGLAKAYKEFHALDNVSFEFNKQYTSFPFLALLGPQTRTD